jgi:UPF0716 protein FxsA
MKRYLAALLLVPLADSLLLVVIAGVLPWQLVVLMVVLTGLLGMFLVRAEGRATLGKLQRKVTSGELPTDELLDAALLIAAGAFLLTPGFVTDVIGLLFVAPPTRIPIRGLLKRVARPYVDERTDGLLSGDVYTMGFPSPGADDDADTVSVDDEAYEIGFEDDEEFEAEDA